MHIHMYIPVSDLGCFVAAKTLSGQGQRVLSVPSLLPSAQSGGVKSKRWSYWQGVISYQEVVKKVSRLIADN